MKSYHTSRRRFLQGAATGAGLLAMPSVIRSARAAGVVNVTTYNGYIPEAFRERFQKDTGIEVNIRLVDDQGKQFNLLVAEAGNPTTDIVTAGAHRFPAFLKAELIQELDLERLGNLATINPLYRNAEWLPVAGKQYGIPLVIGAHGIAYNTDVVSPADAESWSLIFDEKHNKRISWIVLDVVQAAFALKGYDLAFTSYIGKEELASKHVNEARDFVISKKDVVLKYTESGTEAQQLLVNDDVDVAHTDFGPAAKLVVEGLPIRFSIPKEGALGYVHTFNITKGAPNADNAYTFLSALLAEPGIGGALSKSSGLVSAFADSTTGLSDVEKAAFSLSDAQISNIRFERAEAAGLKYELMDKASAEVRAA